jgi:hypothetical protein
VSVLSSFLDLYKKETAMRNSILASAIGVLALTGCASTDYQIYAATQRTIAEQAAAADIARYTALGDIARSGDTAARVAAVMALQQGSTNSNSGATLSAPTSIGDTALRWASVLVPSLTQFYAIGKQTEVAITHSNNSVASQQSNNDMVVDLVQGRVVPIVGTEDDVLIYPR